ncbi:MAG: anaerobic ribonucleoside-triphosphate reductase activating protein [Lachnospiraceae bacterium]|nr:anaerobic ribonucleoside-triphosphate reductase activating protein [Lachnospiraceae bacterium]
MKICGLNKTTLLDYPSHVAATLFVCGCNFRCPFCHNKDLVLCSPQIEEIPMSEILSFLQKRKEILSGVCITGGEPTLYPTLPMFIKTIKDLGYLVKLDTNGTNPEMIKALLKEGLTDYIAMDIKSDRAHYAQAAGTCVNLSDIQSSIDLIRHAGISYEFRTTVVRELHSAEILAGIAQWLSGSEAWYLQNYRESEQVLMPGFSSYTKEELEALLTQCDAHIGRTGIRGV